MSLREEKEKELWVKRLGDTIRKIRLRKGISGVDLAYKLRMDKPNLTRLEKGRINPSVYLIKQVCNALEISIQELFNEMENYSH